MNKIAALSNLTVEDAEKRISYAGRGLRLVWEAVGPWALAWGALLVVQGLLPAAIVYLTKWLVDSVAAAVNGGTSWEVVQMVLVPAALMGSLMILQRVLGSLSSWVSTAQSELVRDHIKGLIHEKAAAVDYGFYESAEYYDRLEQANSQASSRSLALLRNIGNLLQGLVTFLSIGLILIQYGILLPLVLVISTLPALYVIVRHNRRHHSWWERTTADRRWARYFDIMLTKRDPAAEVRLFELGRHFRSNYQDLRKRLREERIALIRDQSLATLGAGTLAILVTAATMVWMGWRALRGLATLGDLALFYQAFQKGQGLMRTLLSSMGEIYTNTLFLEHLFELLEQDIYITDPADPIPMPNQVRKGIDFQDVTFRYPETERTALENFSLHIPAGKTISIVGSNGAGKSTLIKLLCRFYDPEAGSIKLDGVDLRSYPVKELRRQVSVLFQTPVRYHATAAHNISLGDLAGDYDDAVIEKAARGAGAHELIEGLPKKYDTLLGKWFTDGTDLSGGEWQRVSLARAFLREAQVVVLDEPTSHMDSWAENAWLKRFKSMVKDRTAIIVTHRFTTAMLADVIHVMEDGHIVETGSHEELLRQGGRYAESWTTQHQQDGSPSSSVRAANSSEVEALT